MLSCRRRPDAPAGRILAGSALFAAAALALIAPASAIHSGHVQGRILDENGKSIPGATVTISGPEAVGIWQCVTDQDGFYRIAGLTAGHPLTVRIESEERAAIERTGYELRDDQTLRLDFRLRPKGVFSTLVLIDPRVPYHRTALAGARETLPPGVRVFEATEITPAVIRKLNRILTSRPDGVAAIGSVAARLARETVFDIPVVYTMVLDPDKEDLRAKNLCGIPANGAFSEQLEMLSRLAPPAKRIGTLFDPGRLGGVVKQLRAEAEFGGYTLDARAVHDPNTIPEQLTSLAAAGIDAFMVLLDPGLYTTSVFQQVRAFAQEREVILMVPDSAMVRAGATFSYGPGFAELGAYAGRLLTNVMRRTVSVADIGVIFPRTRYLSVNPVDADRFHLTIPKEFAGGSTSPDAPRIIIKPPE